MLFSLRKLYNSGRYFTDISINEGIESLTMEHGDVSSITFASAHQMSCWHDTLGHGYLLNTFPNLMIVVADGTRRWLFKETCFNRQPWVAIKLVSVEDRV